MTPKHVAQSICFFHSKNSMGCSEKTSTGTQHFPSRNRAENLQQSCNQSRFTSQHRNLFTRSISYKIYLINPVESDTV